MDNETAKLIQENIELNKENNKMLRKLVHYQKLSTIYRIFYWTVIILSSLGAYYFAQPFVNKIMAEVSSISSFNMQR